MFLNMKKTIFLLILLLSPIFFVSAAGTTPTVDPNEVITDYECARRIIVEPSIMVDGHPICNRTCLRTIVDSGSYCVWGSDTSVGGNWDGDDLNIPLNIGPVDAAFIYIRAALYAVMGAVALAVVLYGLYGWYQHAMSEGKPDKLELVRKIYTNAIIGAVIVIASFLVVQILATFFGVTTSLFEIDFIPKSGYTVEVREKDVGRVCFEKQVDKSSEGGMHTCVDGKWE
jgi:hypothetical protein